MSKVSVKVLAVVSFVIAPLFLYASSSVSSGVDKERHNINSDISAIVSVASLDGDSFANRSLLCFMDDTEGALGGSVSNSFINAVHQKTGPLLVSCQLFKNVFFSETLLNNVLLKKDPLGSAAIDYQQVKLLLASVDNTNELQKKQVTDLINGYFGRSNLGLQSIDLVKKFGFMVQLDQMVFDKNDWLLFECAGGYILMVPVVCMTIYQKEAQRLNISLDLAAGLKLSSLSKIATTIFDYFINIRNGNAVERPDVKKWDIVSGELAATFKNLFVVHKDYYVRKNEEGVLPFEARWLIYLMGHGVAEGTYIVGMKREWLANVLKFCDQAIVTKLCILSSCYASPGNLDKLFVRLNTQSEVYKFPLVTLALTFAPIEIINGIK